MKRPVKEFKNWGIRWSIACCERFHLLKKFLPGQNPPKFLIVSTTGVGDTLWATPAIRALKETYPGSSIGVLTSPAGGEILKGNPHIDEYFIFREGLAGILSLPRLIKKLRQNKYGIAFIFHASDRLLWPLSYMAGPSEIIGLEGENKGLDFILTQCLAKFQTIHGIEKRLRLVQAAGAYSRQSRLRLYLNGQDRSRALRFLEDNGIDPYSKLIGLHPGAQKSFKCWPLKNFAAVGNALSEKLGCRILITGDGEEKALAAKLVSEIKNACSAAGQLSLRETAALIEKMDLFITNDSGPMHMASALATPTIALFCPTDPALCGPYLDDRCRVIAKPKTCFPCKGKNCDQPVCMEQICPEEVVTTAVRIFGSSPI
jgi:lipopolysaccharide heptosyltransferase II